MTRASVDRANLTPAEVPDVNREPRHLGALGTRVAWIAGGAGVAGLLASVALAALGGDGWQRFFFSYLLSFSYLLTLALGALFFVILHHLTRAGWSVVVRRWAEAVAAVLPYLALAVVPIFVFGMPHLYHWARPEVVAADPLLRGKQPYLNLPFFAIRLVVYFGLWSLLSRFYFGRSLRQDATGDVQLTVQMERRSALAMVGFALTLTFASFDLLMSLDAHWFSTIFGVYVFAGSVVSFFALLTVLVFAAQRAGLVRHVVTVEHYHDLGKLLFAFTVFWAYIAFSQYMLIWYANLPEETEWLLRRQTHGWGWVGLLLLFGHFVVPFVMLLSRAPKRRPALVALAAAWMLLMHWVDLYWVVVPEASPANAVPHLLDLTVLVGLGGVAIATVALLLRDRSLIPERDPRLAESMMFENA
jgi:hypothetical protein